MPCRRILPAILALALLLSSVVGCVGAPAEGVPIKVGSKDFGEQFVLAEMYALVLENAGFQVERKLNLGATPVVHEALRNGQIDLYPEYTGTGLLTVLKLPAGNKPWAVYDRVAAEYKTRFDLVWLDPSPMNNSQALAMTREAAERFGIRTISEFVVKAPELRVVGPPEFIDREDGLRGLRLVYGDFRLREYIPVDKDKKYQLLTAGQADVVVAFGTDGEISSLQLELLEDDQFLFPPYQVAPVVRQQLLEDNPRVAETLNRLAPYLTDEVMRNLNHQVGSMHQDPSRVARDYLEAQDLIRKPRGFGDFLIRTR